MNSDLVSRIVPHRAQVAPDAVALVDGDCRWTYRELANAIERAAQVLSRARVRAGDRVMLVCENRCPAVAFYFACTTIRAWPVLLGSTLQPREIEEIRKHSGARLAIFAGGPALAQRVQSESRDSEAIDFPGGLVFVEPCDENAQIEAPARHPTDDVAALIYTTGTTGTPKGVMLAHGNLMYVARASAAARRLSSDDRLLAILPMSHILGLTGVLLGGLAGGAEIHLQQRFDPAAVLTALRRDRLTVMIGTPAMYAMLGEYAARKGLSPFDIPALRLISTAGAPLDSAAKAAAEALFGQPLHNGYGMTECSPTIALTEIDAPRSDCSVGRLLPGIDAQLVEPGGRQSGEGEPGELWVRGPGVMKGYYRAAEETARILDPCGWLRTGDLARESGGNYYIVGRCKEMAIRFGYKVYPAEIESVLNGHPEVSCSAVVPAGEGDAEDIFAYVQLREGSTIAEGDLSRFAAAQLAPYKRPSKFVLVEKMPLSAAGKILKAELAAVSPP